LAAIDPASPTARRSPLWKRLLQRSVVRIAWTFLRRRNLVRLARFLLIEGRLEGSKEIADNGEAIVQRAALAAPCDGTRVIFDVGAYRGWWTEALLDATGGDFSGLQVHCFEPSQRNHAILLERIAGFPAGAPIHPVKLGMSDAPGELELILSGRGGANSIYQHANTPEDFSTERIELTSIDHYCQEQGIDAITLAKVDAEGHDLQVLHGAARMLGEKRIGMIQFEYNHRWITARAFLKDAFELLQGHGYAVGKVTPQGIEFYRGWDWELETFWEANFLGCLPDWQERLPRVTWWKDS
jgi:FkbM family methyltransferase